MLELLLYFCTWVSTHLNSLWRKFEVNSSSFTGLYPSLFDGCRRSQDHQSFNPRLAGQLPLQNQTHKVTGGADLLSSGRCWFANKRSTDRYANHLRDEGEELVILTKKRRWIIEMKITDLDTYPSWHPCMCITWITLVTISGGWYLCISGLFEI